MTVIYCLGFAYIVRRNIIKEQKCIVVTWLYSWKQDFLIKKKQKEKNTHTIIGTCQETPTFEILDKKILLYSYSLSKQYNYCLGVLWNRNKICCWQLVLWLLVCLGFSGEISQSDQSQSLNFLLLPKWHILYYTSLQDIYHT